MPKLNDYLSLAQLQPFFDKKLGDHSDASRQTYHRNLSTIVKPALVSFFMALKQAGKMPAIPNSDGYKTRFWDAWSLIANAPESSSSSLDNAYGAIASRFAHQLVFDMWYPYAALMKENPDAGAVYDKAEAYNKAMNRMNTGTFDYFEWDSETCQETGKLLRLAFENWAPAGCYFNGSIMVPTEQLAPATLQEAEVTFKTGNLLIADWFRIKEFTELVNKRDISVESREGCEALAKHLAEAFNLVRVYVGNTCPSIYQDGNRLVIGSLNDDEGQAVSEQLQFVGHVCTDLWAASIIEYDNLVALVAQSMPDAAREMVDAYIEENLSQGSYGLNRVAVEPGTYYLYHCGDFENFPRKADAAGLPLDSGAITPFFLLTETKHVK